MGHHLRQARSLRDVAPEDEEDACAPEPRGDVHDEGEIPAAVREASGSPRVQHLPHGTSRALATLLEPRLLQGSRRGLLSEDNLQVVLPEHAKKLRAERYMFYFFVHGYSHVPRIGLGLSPRSER